MSALIKLTTIRKEKICWKFVVSPRDHCKEMESFERRYAAVRPEDYDYNILSFFPKFILPDVPRDPTGIIWK